MFLTQSEIARQCGVSRSTVAMILSNNPSTRVRAEVRERVLKVADSLNYSPNRNAQALRRGRTQTIGVLHFGGLQELIRQKLVHVCSSIARGGFTPVVHDTVVNHQRVEHGVDLLLAARVEGIVLVHPPLSFPQSQINRILKAGIPMVSLGGAHFDGFPRFMADKEKGFYRLTRHLLDLGYRDLALMSGWSTTSRDRLHEWHIVGALDGFKRAAREAGLNSKQARVVFVDRLKPRLDGETLVGPYYSGVQGMRQLLAEGPLPRAVLCSNDSWATGALSVCREEGLRVPEDIAVTGFENELHSAVGYMPLTTMAHPAGELCRMAVEKLLNLIQTNQACQDQLTVLPCQLVVRSSCGAQPQTRQRQRSQSLHTRN